VTSATHLGDLMEAILAAGSVCGQLLGEPSANAGGPPPGGNGGGPVAGDRGVRGSVPSERQPFDAGRCPISTVTVFCWLPR
jgi:hypothetical protein